jgi:hypothetical protein
MIAMLIGAWLGSRLGRRAGLEYGRKRADEIGWAIATELAAHQEAQHGEEVTGK